MRSAFFVFLLASAVAASAQTRCSEPGELDLVVSAMVLSQACDEVSPGTKAERERVVSGLTAEYRDCFAYLQALSGQIAAEARAAAEQMRRATRPPQSTACIEFRARIERAKAKP